MTPEKLADRIRSLRYHAAGDPFDLFVAETMRAIGIPLRDAPPKGEAQEAVRPVVEAYLELARAGEPFADVLGPTYMAYREGATAFAGQFFTPWDVCLMMADLTLGDWKPEPHPNGGLWSILEPAAGSGATLLAVFQTLVRRHGPDVLRMWYAEAWDIDLTVARSCALQVMVTLIQTQWAIGAVRVIHGDTLRMQVRSVVLHGVAAPREAEAPPRRIPHLVTPGIVQGDLFAGGLP